MYRTSGFSLEFSHSYLSLVFTIRLLHSEVMKTCSHVLGRSIVMC